MRTITTNLLFHRRTLGKAIESYHFPDDLDRPAPGRKESAVDQGWRYANYTPDCKWVIASFL